MHYCLLLFVKALIEMCAGNYTNQETAFKGQIVDSVNTMLQTNFRKPTDEEVSEPLIIKLLLTI